MYILPSSTVVSFVFKIVLKIPDTCIVFGCSNKSSSQKGISLHRNKWAPTQMSAVCAAHFLPEDFTRQFVFVPGQSPRQTKDDFGIVAFPSVYKQTKALEPSARACRKVR
jgi:hypothetical protein